MAYLNIWGTSPEGHKRGYAFRVRTEYLQEYLTLAKELGWTELTTSKYEGIETTSLESSDQPASKPQTKRRLSRSAKR